MGAKLILVSNREPYLIRRGNGGVVQAQRVSAGLMGALEPAMNAIGGHWISWSGFEREAPKQGEALPERMAVKVGERSCMLRRIPLTEREASLYYYGFAQRTLGPLMHLQLGRVHFDPEAWRAYRRVNQRFAEAVIEAYEPGDRIWIHDYHLALLPTLLRAQLPSAAIGMSWHVPWAPSDALRALPWCNEIIDGVLGADQIGLSLPRYARQFLSSVEELTNASVIREADGSGSILIAGRRTRVGTFAPGCDFTRWDGRARASRGGRAVRLRRNLVAEKLALAVDRLDHTRGVIERLRAMERFFDRYPSWRGRLVFCQIAVPSRTRVEEYREMKREVDTLVEKINRRFQQGSWMPIRYCYRSFEPDELAVYYAAADIALVTPLADGVSFVPFEYVAARTREDGALILSSLAGAADALPEATLINPFDEEAMAGAVHAALETKPEEMRARMRALRERAKNQNVYHWLRGFWRATWGDDLSLEPSAEMPSLASLEPPPEYHGGMSVQL
ncbi:MAG: trehalose-6-phosphate synthase [Deltaproteobacteria bacterium]|nr:trehalose-6-phosphate synthase [Deltaproteobacteria bacterium]